MCSDRKRGGAELLPAIDRYNGPLWQVLRSYLREQPLCAHKIHVYALSAAFGLIPATRPIPWYDETMTPERADTLRPEVLARFDELMTHGYDQLCFGLSQRYMRTMQGWETRIPTGVAVTHTSGPMGTKLKQLRAWLEDRAYTPGDGAADRLAAARVPRGEVVVAGVTLRMTHDEVLDVARRALADDGAGAAHYRDWYVLVDGRPIAPKWLVSLLTGLPPSRFDASAARRALRALGVDVERVRKGEE
jgi:hypothetical protein